MLLKEIFAITALQYKQTNKQTTAPMFKALETIIKASVDFHFKKKVPQNVGRNRDLQIESEPHCITFHLISGEVNEKTNQLGSAFLLTF